jgi:type II secretory pathway pseudopilin PulG
MRRTVINRVGIALAIGAISVVALWAASVWSAASRSAEESAQRALLAEAAQLLEAFHREHGRYPESLDSLSFNFPDGGDAATLSSLRYNSDGDHYLILVRGAFSGEEFKECR